jgi:DNA-binding NtrC family response regulator
VEDAERAVLELRRAGYAPDCRRAATPREMSAALDDRSWDRPWDLVLCAHSLSDFTYEGALALVREKRIPAPVLPVSAAVVDEAAVSAVKAGARDIIMKDRLSRLAQAAERELEAARNRIRQRALEEGIRRSEKRFRGPDAPAGRRGELRRVRLDVKIVLSSGFNEAEAIQPFAGQRLSGFIPILFS